MTMHSPILRIGWSFLAIAAVSAGCDKLGLGNSPTAPSGPPTPGSAISCAAVGASHALGIGASVECLPYVNCPNGTGCVPDAARQLAGQGFSLTLTNLGVPTAASGPGFQSLDRQYGRTIVGNFIEMEMPAVIDLTCDSRAYAAPNYSSDGFHPNDAGHAFIDSEIVRAVTSSSYPAPTSSCAQMTLVP
jgi:hypothetical protein